MTLSHSFVTELVCALDHSSNAFALAQDCHKIKLHLSVLGFVDVFDLRLLNMDGKVVEVDFQSVDGSSDGDEE